MNYISLKVLGKRILAIKDLLLDPDVSKGKKLLVIFGIIYLFSPLDLIPAPVLGFSVIDDLVLWGFILTHLSDELDSYWKNRVDDSESRRFIRRFKGKNIIKSQGREVEDDAGDSEEPEDTGQD